MPEIELKSSSGVAAIGTAPLISVQTGRVGAPVADVGNKAPLVRDNEALFFFIC